MVYAQAVEGKHGVLKSDRAGMALSPVANANPFLSTLQRLIHTEVEQGKKICAEIMAYLKRDPRQYVSDDYIAHLRKNVIRATHGRVGEFAVTDKGAKQDGGHEWVVTITVENKSPVRILFGSGLDISYSLAEFRALSSNDPTVGLMVNDALFGEGKVTHVELKHELLHNCTVFLD
jgi:hypothetical protein